jgi:pyruvate dehydrogenase E1 component subunit alpha
MTTQTDRLAEQEVALAPEELGHLYRHMVLLRRADSLFAELGRAGTVPFAWPARGLEAVVAGAVAALGPDDWLVPDPRTSGAALLRGYPFAEHLEQLLGTGRDRAHGRTLPGLASYAEGKVAPPAAALGMRAYEALGMAWAGLRAEPRALAACILGPSELEDLRPLDAMERALQLHAPLLGVLVGPKAVTGRWLGLLADHGIVHAFASGTDGAWIAVAARKLAARCRSDPGPAALVCEERRTPDPLERLAGMLDPARERQIRQGVHEEVRGHVVEALGEARAHLLLAAVEAREAGHAA